MTPADIRARLAAAGLRVKPLKWIDTGHHFKSVCGRYVINKDSVDRERLIKNAEMFDEACILSALEATDERLG